MLHPCQRCQAHIFPLTVCYKCDGVCFYAFLKGCRRVRERLMGGRTLKVYCAALPPCALLTPEALLRVRTEPSGEDPRSRRAAPTPRVWEKGAGGGFDRVAGTGRVSVSLSSGPGPRDASPGRKSGAGLGDITRRRSPLRLGRPDRDRQARFDPRRRRSMRCHLGGLGRPSF